ncbi:hypothetical protein B0A49_08745 [Cryomyces minteri]|uniref:Uncharacterized protein n=1 Tax=Cryomyces minteri TaxID=331657 RepID=A0A4U0WQN3_9PEZI|nr:hypothetical protein B0A49_08745 [Cryomyces minteri]
MWDSEKRQVFLGDTDTELFERFLLAEIWILGDQLGCVGLQDDVMAGLMRAHFCCLTKCKDLSEYWSPFHPETLEYVFANTKADSKLRNFYLDTLIWRKKHRALKDCMFDTNSQGWETLFRKGSDFFAAFFRRSFENMEDAYPWGGMFDEYFEDPNNLRWDYYEKGIQAPTEADPSTEENRGSMSPALEQAEYD